MVQQDASSLSPLTIGKSDYTLLLHSILRATTTVYFVSLFTGKKKALQMDLYSSLTMKSHNKMVLLHVSSPGRIHWLEQQCESVVGITQGSDSKSCSFKKQKPSLPQALTDNVSPIHTPQWSRILASTHSEDIAKKKYVFSFHQNARKICGNSDRLIAFLWKIMFYTQQVHLNDSSFYV